MLFELCKHELQPWYEIENTKSTHFSENLHSFQKIYTVFRKSTQFSENLHSFQTGNFAPFSDSSDIYA